MTAAITPGESDDSGFNVVKDRAHAHDLRATMLPLPGFGTIRS
jgi:hypothetical protein